MATDALKVVFDGVNEVQRLPGQSAQQFFGSPPDRAFMDVYNVYHSVPGNDLDATADLTGSNWNIRYFRIAGDDSKVTIRDLDNGSDRRVDLMELGWNSDVDLITTRVRHFVGWEGDKHSITLSDQQEGSVYSLSLFGEVNEVTTGNRFVQSIWTGVYDGWRGVNGQAFDPSVAGDRIVVNAGGSNSVQTGIADDEVVVNGSFVGSVRTRDGDDVVTVNAGGNIRSVDAGSGNDRIVVNKDGRITTIDSFEGNKTLIVRDGGRVDQFRGGEGNKVDITLEGDARMETITAYSTDLTVVTGTRFVDAIKGFNVNSDIVIGTGGVGSIRLGSDVENDHKVVANGFVGAIDFDDSNGNPDNDQASNIKLNSFAGNIRLGERKDVVTTGDADAWVESIATNGGNDIVNLGASGAGAVNLGLGNDRISLKKLVDDSSDGFFDTVQIKGGAGTDTILFTKFAGAVTFSLENSAGAQEVSGNSRAFQVNGFENLTGSKRNDDLTGNDKANVIKGGNGNDRLAGLEGNDLLIGAKGRDVFVFAADAGTDRVKGFQKGQDSIEIADHAGGFRSLDISKAGKNLEIDHDGGTIVLLGKGGVNLTADDFDFV